MMRVLDAPRDLVFQALTEPERLRRWWGGAGIKGQDSARPGECWVDVSGTVRGVNLTDNSWVRARPDQMLAVAQALR
jgi:uncharacterized protein YndB with AHSA1/START domain